MSTDLPGPTSDGDQAVSEPRGRARRILSVVGKVIVVAGVVALLGFILGNIGEFSFEGSRSGGGTTWRTENRWLKGLGRELWWLFITLLIGFTGVLVWDELRK